VSGRTSSLSFKLFGQDVSATRTLKGVGTEARSTGKHFRDMGKIAGGAMAGIGLAAAGQQLLQFGKDSMDAFQNTGGVALKLQRYMGGTAEDASRLGLALKLTGVDSEAAAKSFGIFSKFSSAAGDQLDSYDSKVAAAALKGKAFTGQLGGSASAFAKLGVQLRGADGEARPMKDLLIDMADQISKMPPGVDKTTLVLKAFGKQGMAMLPFLNKGAAGIEEMMAKSDELGTTLSGADLEAVKANTKAKREFAATVEGVQISLGRGLYPVLTTMMNYFKSTLLPVLKTATDFFLEHSDVILKVATVIGVVLAAVKGFNIAMGVFSTIVRVATGLQAAWNLVMMMNPIGLIVLAIIAFIGILVLAYNKVGWFRDLVDKAWAGIKVAISAVVKWFQQTAWPILKTVIGYIVGYYRTLWTVFTTVVGWIIGRGVALVTWFRELPGRVTSAVSGLWDGIKNSFRNALNWVIRAWNSFRLQFPSFDFDWNGPLPGGEVTVGGWTVDTPNLPMLARGGTALRSGLAIVGERGPEIVSLNRGATVMPLGRAGGTVLELHLDGIVIGGSRRSVGRELLGLIDDAIASGGARPNRLMVRGGGR
jgi:hypothetical protein